MHWQALCEQVIFLGLFLANLPLTPKLPIGIMPRPLPSCQLPHSQCASKSLSLVPSTLCCLGCYKWCDVVSIGTYAEAIWNLRSRQSPLFLQVLIGAKWKREINENFWTFDVFSIVFVGYIQTIGNSSAIIHLMDNLLLVNGDRCNSCQMLFPSQVHGSLIHRNRMEHTREGDEKPGKQFAIVSCTAQRTGKESG